MRVEAIARSLSLSLTHSLCNTTSDTSPVLHQRLFDYPMYIGTRTTFEPPLFLENWQAVGVHFFRRLNVIEDMYALVWCQVAFESGPLVMAEIEGLKMIISLYIAFYLL